MNPNLSTSGALLHPSPQNHLAHRDTSPSGRKRAADGDLDVRPAQRPSPPAVAQPIGVHGTPRENTPQPRKVLAPGATKAAIARLAELRAQGAVGGAPAPAPAPTPFSNPAPPMHALPAMASGKKVLAPGATLAAMARLASRNSGSSLVSSASLSQPSPPIVPRQAPIPTGGGGSTGPKKVLAPGATQAAMARLASLKTAGSNALPATIPASASAAAAAAPGPLPPPPRPLFGPSDYSLGTVVWAKMQSYPWWPAQVQRPSAEQARLRHSPSDIFIVFYGTADYTWLPLADLKPFRVNLPDYGRFASSKNKGLQRAIDEAWVSLGQPRPDILGKVPGGH